MAGKFQNQTMRQMESRNKDNVKQPDPKDEAVKNDDCKCSRNCGCCDERKEKKLRESLLTPKTVTAASMFVLSISVAFGQGQPSFGSDPFNSPMLPLYITMAFVVVTIAILVVAILYVLRAFNIVINLAEKERAEKLGLPVTKKLSWLEQYCLPHTIR